MRKLLGLGILALQALVAGCGLDAGVQEDTAEEELAADVTISRVPNPPLMSDLINLPGDLHAIAAPLPPNLGDFIADRDAAIALGKALFWDMQVGSDGVQACASCHFRAGADPRSKNQVSPGLKHVPQPDVDFTTAGPNAQLKPSDFPLTRLAVPGVRGALDPAHDSNDVVSSQGVSYQGNGLDPMGFNVGDTNTRRVEPRNTPSVINAVYNHRQFWDGRAENVFNGVNSLGTRDPNARVVRAANRNNPALVRVELKNASLASQAVVPVLSDMEMSANGRSMFDVAAKLLDRRPLAKQLVDRTDSVLGHMSRAPGHGLKVRTYAEMIRAAFRSDWWDSSKQVRIARDGSVRFVGEHDRDHDRSGRQMSVMAYNFSLFFGLSIMMYESTLVSSESPWDKFRRQHPDAADPALNPWTNTNPEFITRGALWGAMLFNDRSRGPSNVRCSNCHESNELTDASVRKIEAAVNGPVKNRDGNIIDKGFGNIGVRPTADDLGVGASDAFGPLSYSRREFPGALPANFDGLAVTNLGVDGAFKIPSLRNVALTAPYFHNGDARTLREVLEFYSRGGNVAPILNRDGSAISPLGMPGLTEDEILALISFLKSLTDDRVLHQQAPFDHPQLFVPNGACGDDDHVRAHRDTATDNFVELEAVGANGGKEIPGFLEGAFGPDHHGECRGNGADHDDDDDHDND